MTSISFLHRLLTREALANVLWSSILLHTSFRRSLVSTAKNPSLGQDTNILVHYFKRKYTFSQVEVLKSMICKSLRTKNTRRGSHSMSLYLEVCIAEVGRAISMVVIAEGFF